MNILNIAKANIQKKKSASASLYVLIVIAALLIHSGFGIMMNVNSFFIQKTKEMNSPHYFLIMTKSIFQDSYLDFFKQDPRVSQYEIEETVYMENVKFNYGSAAMQSIIIYNADKQRDIAPIKWIEKSDNIPGSKSIYLPYSAKFVGYSIGDTYQMEYKNKYYDYLVAGFYESTERHMINSGIMKYFLSQDAFEDLYQEIGGSVAVSVLLNDYSQSARFKQDYRNQLDIEISLLGDGSMDMDYSMNSLVGKATIQILASLFIIFALIVVVITLMVIKFRVSNSIEDNMRNIGILGAIGYTSQDIIFSMIAEYGIISILGGISGVIFSRLLIPAINNIMVAVSGIIWRISIPISLSLMTCLAITILILAVTFLSSNKIKRLPPVIALRGGLATHSFQKNYIPLNKGIGSVHFRLGCKNIFVNMRMYLMLGVILAGITFTLMAVVIATTNIVYDRTAIMQMSGFELSDVFITVSNHTDCQALVEDIEEMEMVRKTSMVDFVTIRVDGIDITGNVSEDFSKMETFTVYAGTMPQYNNEIVITGIISDQINKKIGDTVEVKAGGISQNYIITGLTQTLNNAGAMGLITLDGYQRLVPDYQRKLINVYLQDGEDINDFILELQDKFGVVNVKKKSDGEPQGKYQAAKEKAEDRISTYLSQYGVDSVQYAVILDGEIILSGSSAAYKIEEITNYRETTDSLLGVFMGGFTVLMQTIFIVSIFIIGLILFLIVKSIIAKRRIEFGILKANGYTTIELMLQLAFSFVPVSILGIAAGTALGAIFVNPIFSNFFYSAGVSNLKFSINLPILLLVGMIMTIITFIMSMAAAYKIKSISVCELLAD